MSMETFAGLWRYINEICVGMCPTVSIFLLFLTLEVLLFFKCQVLLFGHDVMAYFTRILRAF